VDYVIQPMAYAILLSFQHFYLSGFRVKEDLQVLIRLPLIQVL